MSIFSLLKKAPSSQPNLLGKFGDAARHLLPDGEKNGPARASIPLPLGERVDRPKGETGEGAFQAANCAIWNDIQRALESK
ncbi:hypothetical protein [Devosia sp.]|uniref:hypothetical protein n=1 Tax=Devosia sp. TaxID=1871048 RepID=UPI0025CE1BE3|nr:hypothetical protein [Devosia sp.]MCR6635517.1 hypothetical protein [Devosia sp.]